MTDLILHALTFALWLAYLFPPLAFSRNKVARAARTGITAVLGACVGFGLGNAIAEVLKK